MKINKYRVQVVTLDGEFFTRDVATLWHKQQFQEDIQRQIKESNDMIIIGDLMIWTKDIGHIDFYDIKEEN